MTIKQAAAAVYSLKGHLWTICIAILEIFIKKKFSLILGFSISLFTLGINGIVLHTALEDVNVFFFVFCSGSFTCSN